MNQSIRTLGIALVVGVAGLVGCSVEGAPEVLDESADGAESVESIEQAGTLAPEMYKSTTVACTSGLPTAAQKEAQYRATRALAWMMGGSTNPAPNTPACERFNAGANSIRTLLTTTSWTESLNGKESTFERWGSTTRCGLPATIYYIDDFGSTFDWLGTAADLNNCLGPNVNEFLRVTAEHFREYGTNKSLFTRSKFDPEPATLTAALGSTTGATAAAYYSNTPEYATSVVKFGSSYATCGTYVSRVGEPCSPTALAAGAQVSTVLVRNGAMCACR